MLDTLGLGAAIWLMGYLASLFLYFVVPAGVLGWLLFVAMTPIALCIAYLRFGKRRERMRYYLMVAAAWTALAVVLDYLFIVAAFHSSAYYKADVFVYYLTTFAIPLLVGFVWGRKRQPW